MKQYVILFLLALSCPFLLAAQDFSVGFKAGLNFTDIDGPSEVDGAGNALEDNQLTTGFVFGARFNVQLTDQFGVRSELIYGQKGAEYSFEGPSYWSFATISDEEVFATGERRSLLKITNSYLEIPVMGYARFGRVEFSAGLSIGALLSSRGTGSLIFSGETFDGVPVDPVTIELGFNYLSDPLTPAEPDNVDTRVLGGNTVEIPIEIGAYFENPGSDTRAFNRLDLGLNAEIAFFLNQGLYLGLRGSYGLSDITRIEQDYALTSLDNSNEFIFQDDKDHNISLQASLGFSF